MGPFCRAVIECEARRGNTELSGSIELVGGTPQRDCQQLGYFIVGSTHLSTPKG